MEEIVQVRDFDTIKLTVASPDNIHGWSLGEVTKPETINYRTQKPEKDGLFCERIFGPSKDWECYCGKYKKIRYKGITCDKCGVEVTRALVRRERMGHIDLKVPVSHIWFLRGVPSKIGLVLDISIQNLEKVIYFANFIIMSVDEEAKDQALNQIKSEYKAKLKQIENEIKLRREEVKKSGKEKTRDDEIKSINKEFDNQVHELERAVGIAQNELKELQKYKIISESVYQDLSMKYGHIFEAGIGAEAIHQLLQEIDIDFLIKTLEEDLKSVTTGVKHEKMVRRVKLLKSLKRNAIRPEWMVMTVLPVIPPDLRPMVALDGGRFATSDLNDLYRRVINRNNRLKQLIELNAPEVITRNEKRMLQEAVDALIDNAARHGKTVVASTGQKRQLKSLADMLKGKQGRFRQNLLGKRTDYSGRSVIVVGPNLKMNECGLPKKMALELFRPFVISRLIRDGFVFNVRSANRYIESDKPEVWAILEEIISEAYVLLNRAPTLHRLGIQAFRPKLIEGKAIQIHPMVCAAFNADFDGDQMAVHVPLTEEAKREASEIMLSTHNLIKPATGEPVAKPDQDVVWGCYYLTFISADDSKERDIKKLKHFTHFEEVILAYTKKAISLQDPIIVRVPKKVKMIEPDERDDHGRILTTAGRIIFNEIIPDKLPFFNKILDKKSLGIIVRNTLLQCGDERTAELLDSMKNLGYRYLTQSGLSWGLNALPDLKEKKTILKEAEDKVEVVEDQFNNGLLTSRERYNQIIQIWTEVKDVVTNLSKEEIKPGTPVVSMVDSGARGSWSQLAQIVGMKGLVTNPAGEIIELPVKANFKEGFNVLEYFISTHGARKGLTDTALRTANAGYLTRRLIGVAQDVIITENDCKTKECIVWTQEEKEETGRELAKRLLGRVIAEDLVPKGKKKIILKKGTLVTRNEVERLYGHEFEEVKIRSVLACTAAHGLCKKCYGLGPNFEKEVEQGTAVGIIAAQSIGEPGTQLTMRTFHTGGIASDTDITQGLPRVEELFEARSPKANNRAILADRAGQVIITEGEEEQPHQKILKINFQETAEERYHMPKKESEKKSVVIKVKKDQKIRRGTPLFSYLEKDGTERIIKSKNPGVVQIHESHIGIEGDESRSKEYPVPPNLALWVTDGAMVEQGQQLTEGHLDVQQLYHLRGRTAVQKYIINEIQHIYNSQGQDLNDTHIEIITRQMFSRLLVKNAGDTDLLPGEIVEREFFDEANRKTKKEKGKLADGKELLLGITKSSLSTRSFLSAAAFQETSRVLINAAVNGQVDRLEGLKENVIIGRLIPAGTGFKKKK